MMLSILEGVFVVGLVIVIGYPLYDIARYAWRHRGGRVDDR